MTASTAAAADPAKTRLAKDLAHDRPLVCCRFAPAGPLVFAGSEDESILRWDVETGAKAQLKGHESWVFALDLTPDGRTLVSGGGDGRLIWWPADGDAPLRKLDAHRGWVNAVAMSPDGARVASAGNDRIVRIWSAADGALEAELPGHERPVYAVRFDATGKALITADLFGRIVFWDVETREEARRLDGAKLYKYEAGQGVDYGGVRDFALSPDGTKLAASGLIEASNPLGAVSNPAVLVFEIAEGKEPRLQRPKEDVKGVGWGVRWHPDGFVVMVSGGTGGGWLWFLRPDAENEFHKVNLTNTGRALDLHPDGVRLATAHHDGHLRIWSMTEAPAKTG
jgi:WD40 repeat protein